MNVRVLRLGGSTIEEPIAALHRFQVVGRAPGGGNERLEFS